MPITRSMGRAPKTWTWEVPEEEPLPATDDNRQEDSPMPTADPMLPSTVPVEDRREQHRDSPADTLRTTIATRSAPNRNFEERQEPNRGRDVQSIRSPRPNRKIIEAREEILKLKLQLAQLALQKAEEDADSDGYVDDGQSKAEYVRSWLQEAPEPQQQEALVSTEAVAGQCTDEAAEPHQRGTTREQKIVSVNEKQEEASMKKVTSPPGSDPMTQLITGLTSTIAALAEKKPLETSHTATHPAISKVIMTLPTFDGAHTEWLSFRAIYDTTKKYFNDVENTARLRRSLKGKALETVSSELIGNARPDDIMKELQLQFGRTDAIAQAESDKLRNLPRCGEAPRDICTFAGKVRSGIVTLEALKKQHYLINAELLRVLTEKLPNSLRLQWYRTYTEKYASVPDLRRFSEYVTEQAHFCSAFAPAETGREPPSFRRTVQRTHTVIEKPAGKPNFDPNPRCRICEQEGHHSADCHIFRGGDSNRRWELAKKHGLCFRCLRARSRQHVCKLRQCGKEGCTASHNQLLHYERQKTEKQKTEKQETVASSSVCTDRQAYLKIVPVQLVGPAGEIATFALLDDGSTVSLIDEEIAQAVGAEGNTDPFTIRTIGDTAIEMPASRRIEVTLKTSTGNQTPLHARTVPYLRLTPQRVTEEDIAECKHLVDISDQLLYQMGLPKILIGQDNWHLLVASTVRRGPAHQPVASLTQLGWTLHGAHTRTIGHKVHFVSQMSIEENIDQQLKQYFALESLIVNPRRPKTDPEKIAEEILEKNTRKIEDGHIETALLWKTENIEMPDSYENAVKRLASIEKKLDRNPVLKLKYTEQIDSLIEKGYAEEAPQNSTSGRTWYLPHFDVHNPMKPEKIRIVHDAAAKSNGKSLNDYLLTGPDLLQSLPGVMMRFRRHPIAVSADITEMFMQVRVRTEDRDTLRYLWRGDRREGAPKEYRMKSIIFGAASSPCTAIFAKNWNARRYIQEHPEGVEAIVNNHYMDDYLDSFRDIETASRTAKIVRDIHREAHFELKKWVSNSSQVIEKIEPNQSNIETVSLVRNEQREKILGLIWEPSTDELSFNLELARLPDYLISKKTPTRREALRVIMSLYDPLGLASPVTVRAKQILQDAWRTGKDWDSNLDEDLAKRWTTWLQHLENLKTVKVPRCYPGYSDAASLQLHVFVDASELAYATAAYWRVVTPEGQVHVTLVMAKARVAPLKLLSIPRLELQAAVMGTRVATAVIESHHVLPESTTYWSDSKTVLTWIRRGSRQFKPFVAHRLADIEDNSKTDDWRWVPTKLNIADAATRDVPVDFNLHHEWYTGPSFLYEDPSLWPKEKPVLNEVTGEERTHAVVRAHRKQTFREAIPDPNRFSKWERLLRTTARVLQFIALCRTRKEQVLYKRTQKNEKTDTDWRNTKTQKNNTSGRAAPRPAPDARRFVFLPAEHTHDAEDLLVKAVQEDSFGADLWELRRGQEVARNSRLYPLSVEYKEGIITLRSRIIATDTISQKMKSPPILDGEHKITQLYIEWTHRKLHHSGIELVINELRQHYWILRLRPTTKKIVRQCVLCRIRKARPPEPATGDLPRARLAHHQRAFTYTGLDYFGPLSVTVGRQHQKRYVALFTCLTSRAVHLEIAASLSADSAVMALRRFAARRGCPAEIYSDNGTNMHGADREIRDAIKEEASRRGIVWRFITPAAPFMGGAWERLVRCVKTTLNTVLHERHPHEEVLTTLLCEAEYTVNSRPLTHVSVNADDEEAITPNHILFGGSARLPLFGEFNDTEINSKKHWHRTQVLADQFWRRWVREYLPELQNRREPHGSAHRFEINDPVLIVDGNLPRNTWPRGRVTAVYPGPDGQIRTIEVKTLAGTLKRPAKKLIPLPK